MTKAISAESMPAVRSTPSHGRRSAPLEGLPDVAKRPASPQQSLPLRNGVVEGHGLGGDLLGRGDEVTQAHILRVTDQPQVVDGARPSARAFDPPGSSKVTAVLGELLDPIELAQLAQRIDQLDRELRSMGIVGGRIATARPRRLAAAGMSARASARSPASPRWRAASRAMSLCARGVPSSSRYRKACSRW